MKRFYTRTLLAALLLLCSTVASAHNFEVDGIYYNILSSTDKTVAVTYKGSSYSEYSNEYSGAVTIPASVIYDGTTYCVTGIGDYAFCDCSSLTSITIPNSVTTIGQFTFSRCSSLTNITIPNSVTTIGSNAFSKCSSLTNVTIPNNITTIGSSAFNGCSGLTSVTIGNSVTYIGSSAFSSCSGLTSVTIPNSITYIGSSAFSKCSNLKEVLITDLTAWCNIYFSSNDSNPLYYAKNLYLNGELVTNLVIPDSITEIGNNAFTGCNIARVTIPNSVTRIKDRAFSECTGLISVTIPNSTTTIEYGAFEGCSSLKSVTIPNSVTTIEERAFYNCSSLTSITIPNSVTTIGNSAFYGCSGLTSVTIPNSVKKIEYGAFNNCTNLKTVINLSNLTISKGSSDYGYVAYYADVVINAPCSIEGNYIFSVIGGINTLCLYLGNETSIVLPGSYNGKSYVIGEYAFKGCTSLTSVTIPECVTNIGNYAFYGCTNLTSVTIPNSVTNIGNFAFYNCTNLASVTIPNNVTNIGNYAFYNCKSITSITIPYSVTTIGNSAFKYCTNLASVTIGNCVTTIGNEAFYNCTSLASVTIGNCVTSIGNEAFYGCTNLKTVINLSNLTISAMSSRNGYVAYYANKVINVPNGFIEGDYIFSVSDGVYTLCNYIGNETSIVLPESYNGMSYVIGNNAFSSCKSLTSITIPNSVTTIGNYAFYNCTNLKAIYSKAEIPAQIDYYTFCDRYNATLYVPKGSKAAYLATDFWSNFTNIVEMDFDITGDITGDGIVNVGDITTIASMILDESLINDAADINDDGVVNVGDITTLVSIILGTESASASAR